MISKENLIRLNFYVLEEKLGIEKDHRPAFLNRRKRFMRAMEKSNPEELKNVRESILLTCEPSETNFTEHEIIQMKFYMLEDKTGALGKISYYSPEDWKKMHKISASMLTKNEKQYGQLLLEVKGCVE